MFNDTVLLSGGKGPLARFKERHPRATLENAFFGIGLCAKVAGGLLAFKTPSQTIFGAYRKRADKLLVKGEHARAGRAYLKAAYFSQDKETLGLVRKAFSSFKAAPAQSLEDVDRIFIKHEYAYDISKQMIRSDCDAPCFDPEHFDSSRHDYSPSYIHAYYISTLRRLEEQDKGMLDLHVRIFHMHSYPHIRTFAEMLFQDTAPIITLGEALAALRRISQKRRPFSIYNFYVGLGKARENAGGQKPASGTIEATCADTGVLFEEWKILASINNVIDNPDLACAANGARINGKKQ